MSEGNETEGLIVERMGPVATLRINRPKQLNALNLAIMQRLVELLAEFDGDDTVHCVVLAGGDRAFAAGADITEMAGTTLVDQYKRNQFARWEKIKRFSKPLVGAVSGYCLGGGCELMMHCDIVVASETARFGQPEINIGVIPGAGGTQRLTRAVGKAVAMDVILTGRFLTAREALDAGLISRVVPVEHYLEEALQVARTVAEKPPLATRMAKESVLKAHEMSLSDGLEYERKLFYMLFATEDQREGMNAFVEKRRPEFKGR